MRHACTRATHVQHMCGAGEGGVGWGGVVKKNVVSADGTRSTRGKYRLSRRVAMLQTCSSQCVFGFLSVAAMSTSCAFGSGSMTREDVAVVCVLVLLFRLGRFPVPHGFPELRPLFRVSVCTLDAYVDGLCVDVRDDVQRFAVEPFCGYLCKVIGPYPSIQAHTGTVDALWKCLKEHAPPSLGTRVQKAGVNPLLMQYTRQWQWRYVNANRGLLLRTGHAMYRHYFG